MDDGLIKSIISTIENEMFEVVVVCGNISFHIFKDVTYGAFDVYLRNCVRPSVTFENIYCPMMCFYNSDDKNPFCCEVQIIYKKCVVIFNASMEKTNPSDYYKYATFEDCVYHG